MSQDNKPSLMRALGPGLIFAGAAVGVSHLVQSTLAGAGYGLALILVVIGANLFKYAPFSFGPRYAAATGTSLLEGYRRQGKWALVLYGLLTLGTMFTVQAAVTLLTVGLLAFLLGIPPSGVVWVALGLTLLCVILLYIGHYRWLENIIKVAVAVLTLSVLVATVMVLPKLNWSGSWLPPGEVISDPVKMTFLIGLIGWMPSAIDISVWNSLWTLAKKEESGGAVNLRTAMQDFNIGYIGTALLAVCFVVMGAGVFHGSGVEIAKSPGKFAAQVITIFTESIGGWIKPVIAVACVATMFSTTLAVVDGFPRAIAVLVERFREEEKPGAQSTLFPKVRWGAMLVISAGAMVIIAFFAKSLLGLVALATALSFLTAPVLSFLNHRAITGSEVPVEARPGRGMLVWSWIGIIGSAALAIWYLWAYFN